MRESNDHDHAEPSPEVVSELRAELPAELEVLTAPLDRRKLDAIIDQAVAQRQWSAAGPAKVSFLRRHRWVPALAIGGALAAGLSLVVRTDDHVDPFELEMRPGNTKQRGEAPRGEQGSVYDLRNEPLWKVRAAEGAADDLQLYLVAQTALGMELLRPRIEQTGSVFRVLGELGEMGLRPGEVTVHFVLGPGAREAEVVSRMEAHLSGAALPGGWQVQSRGIHIKGG